MCCCIQSCNSVVNMVIMALVLGQGLMVISITVILNIYPFIIYYWSVCCCLQVNYINSYTQYCTSMYSSGSAKLPSTSPLIKLYITYLFNTIPQAQPCIYHTPDPCLSKHIHDHPFTVMFHTSYNTTRVPFTVHFIHT